MVDDVLACSALTLAERVRRGELSSEELTRFFLERIERLDPQVNAFVTVLRRRALWTARHRDRQRRGRDDLPSFHGVPSGLKDLVPMFGTPTKMGSRAYRWLVSPIDVPAARRFQRGGFVVLGKLATSEFGVLPITEPAIHPPTRNPWSLDHTPGGSSGGSGAAVAAMMLPVAQGSDGGGSVRIPASLCHLYGFKPSLSLLGNLHGPINRLGMSVMGPLTHHVEDAAAMLDVLRGNHHTHKGDDASSCLARMRIAPRPLRIRVSYTSPLGRIEPEMVAATEATARTLESLGHHIETVAMMTVELEDFLPLWQLMIATVPSPAERWLEPVTQWLRRAGRKLDVDAVKRRQRELSARLDTQIGDADVFLTPTVPVTPPRVGSLAHLEPEALFRAVSDLGAFTAAFNISHGPAASLPAGVSSAGVPIGVQIGARPGDDHLLLALSRQLEEAQPWRQRVAPLAAS